MARGARSFQWPSEVERCRESAVPATKRRTVLGLGGLLAVALSALRPAGFAAAETLSVAAAQQIQSLLAEKESRTPAQRKIDSKLLYAMRQSAGLDAAPGVPSLQTGVAVDSAGTTEVHLTAFVSVALLSPLRAQGVQILDVYAPARSIRARVPLAALETVAADPSVVFI